MQLVDREQLIQAQQVIRGRVHRTRMIGSEQLGRRYGTRLYFKPELFQKTGAFKVRGVLNALEHMPAEDRRRGVISISAGNHAQALAWGAAQFGMESTIVMPASAVKSKIEATRAYGGHVVLTDGDLMETCATLQKERNLTLVHPFDHPDIIAGQGTIGLEILEDVPDVDVIISGIGGGGLISGIAAAIKTQRPEVRMIGVEPAGSCAMKQSVEQGEPVRLTTNHTVADGLAAPFAGVHTLAHVQAYVDELVLVTDDEIVEAMFTLLEWCKIVPEPAAASSFAALMHGKIKVEPESTVVCILSGGNIDRRRMVDLLTG